jgi:NADH-quinone oxidoreductase subunit G
VARLKPRLNPDVNAWWICDEGRYGFGWVDAATRLTTLTDETLTAVVDALRRYGSEEIAVLASPQMANEDLMALKRLLEHRGIRQVAFAVPPAVPGRDDDFLLRADRNPNSRGAELLGLGGDAAALLAAARAGRIRCLLIFDHDLRASGLPAADVSAALSRIETVIYAGTNANATSEAARWVLPLAAWVERDGTFTNFEGRVQRFRPAIDPVGQARPAWDLIGQILTALAGTSAGTRAEHWFREIVRTVPAFAGMSYQSIGDAGQMIAGAVSTGAPPPPGRRPQVPA